MKTRTRLAVATCLVAVAATVLSACSSSGGGGNSTKPANTVPASNAPSAAGSSSSAPGGSGYNAAVNGVANPSTKAGGTLKLISTVDCDSWDPQRTYTGWCLNMQRVFTRTLITYTTTSGKNFKLVPDLATTMGTHNADYTEWSYTLKPGLKWSNGKQITAADVQWGISRLWATSVITGGPNTYFVDGIKAAKGYRGPYKDGPNTVGMTVTGTDKITFHLTGPNAEFDNLLAMVTSAPVPARVEGGTGFTGATYTKHPAASGPFEIASYTPNKAITFVRNPNWSQATDTVRHPLVNKITVDIDTSTTDVDQKIETGQVDADASQPADAPLQTWILTNPQHKANADNPVGMGVTYFAIIPSVIPNVHCRRAIFYAIDKSGFLRAYGGSTSGQVATSMTPDGIPGYQAGYDPYPAGKTGNLAKAKQELQACGKPDGFTTKLAYASPDPHASAAFTAEQQALAKVGIRVSPSTTDQSTYYSTFVGSPAHLKQSGIGLAIANWGPDFPTGIGFYQAIANGNAIVATGNANYPSLNDPTVNKVLDAAPAGKATEADWQSLDHAIMNDAVYLPMFYSKSLHYRNPRLTNLTCNALRSGVYDWVNVGVGG